MRSILRTAVLVVAMSALSSAAFAAAPATPKPAVKAATHSVTGMVKSIDATNLVITVKKGRDMTFAVNPATKEEGTLAVGSRVSVRYHVDGTSHVATAVIGPHPKAAAPKQPAAVKPSR